MMLRSPSQLHADIYACFNRRLELRHCRWVIASELLDGMPGRLPTTSEMTVRHSRDKRWLSEWPMSVVSWLRGSFRLCKGSDSDCSGFNIRQAVGIGR